MLVEPFVQGLGREGLHQIVQYPAGHGAADGLQLPGGRDDQDVQLFENQGALVWTLIASLYVGNLMLLVLNLPLVGLWV